LIQAVSLVLVTASVPWKRFLADSIPSALTNFIFSGGSRNAVFVVTHLLPSVPYFGFAVALPMKSMTKEPAPGIDPYRE
jgi:hypothetical protein